MILELLGVILALTILFVEDHYLHKIEVWLGERNERVLPDKQ